MSSSGRMSCQANTDDPSMETDPIKVECEHSYETASSSRTWSDVREDVRSLRQKLWSSIGQRLPNGFVFNNTIIDNVPTTKVYFLSTPLDSRDACVYSISLPSNAPALTTEQDQAKIVTYPWNLTLSCTTQRTLSKEEQLLFERKRKKPSGISWFDFENKTNRFLFSSGPQLFEAVDEESAQKIKRSSPTEPFPAVEIKQQPGFGSPAARINSEFCPHDPNLIAYVSGGNVWVIDTSSNIEYQLTNVHQGTGDVMTDPIFAGFPSYIIQEEFDRYKGFWWKPQTPESEIGVYQILYEVVNESKVKIVHLPGTSDSGEPEVYRFPVPGSPNAESELKLLELRLNKLTGEMNFSESSVQFPIKKYFEWAEYLVRVGWTPDGKFVWVQVLNRSQTRLDLVLFPVYPNPTAPFYVIYSETSHHWINVTDIISFIPSTTDNNQLNKFQFIWASEETGFRHLYFVESELRPSIVNESPLGTGLYHLSPNVIRKIPLTSGEWEITDIASLDVNHEKKIIFFHGLYDSPIERHIYAVSYNRALNATHQSYSGAATVNGASQNIIRRLSNLGFSYNATFNNDCSLVVMNFSSTTSTPVCKLFRVVYNEIGVSGIVLEPLAHFLQPKPRDPVFSSPEISCHKLEDGAELYAMVYKPLGFDPEKKYPAILNIYGGPHVQMVINSYKGPEFYSVHLLTTQGYCVINVDSRGSYHRGLEFEAHLKNRMGTVEMKDQVEVLHQLFEQNPYIDSSRLGIFGWSYGGYLTLMGLILHPEIFKVAVAGAPVCTWDLYDTGYTERYMNLPAVNPNGYQMGSILSYITLFPDEEDRLLIFHGLLDENVHFSHTAKLVSALISAGKPHSLQVYPTERHSLRTWEASEHFETTFICFLKRCL